MKKSCVNCDHSPICKHVPSMKDYALLPMGRYHEDTEKIAKNCEYFKEDYVSRMFREAKND